MEIVISRQWYIRNGGGLWVNPASGADLNAELLECGHELDFHPDFMCVRYENARPLHEGTAEHLVLGFG